MGSSALQPAKPEPESNTLSARASQAERRQRVRVAARLPLTVKFGGLYETKGEALNISTQGMLFLADRALEAGSKTELVFRLPRAMIGRDGVWLRCAAEVVRVGERAGEKKFGVAARLTSHDVFEVS